MSTFNTPFMEVEEEPLHRELYKDEFIRIYLATLEPGQMTEFHRHSKNTLYIVYKGGRIGSELLKGSPSCPTVLPQKLSMKKRVSLLFEKIFCRYLTLDPGFLFYMPSEKYPVIHRAVSSNRNSGTMELLGIEMKSGIGK